MDSAMSKMFRQLVEKDIDFQETVSFNFPKYEEKGTPHDVWMKNTNDVEIQLEKILEAAPYPNEFPMAHVRREEKDGDGRIIRVHLDVYGKTTMVKFALDMLNRAVNTYVSRNVLQSDAGEKIMEKVPAEIADVMLGKTEPTPEVLDKIKEMTKSFGPDKMSKLGLKAEVIPISDPSNVKGEVEKHFKSLGIDPKEVKIVSSSLVDAKTGESLGEGPLDLSGLDTLEGDTDEPINVPFILPNPDPDEFN